MPYSGSTTMKENKLEEFYCVFLSIYLGLIYSLSGTVLLCPDDYDKNGFNLFLNGYSEF